MIYNHRGEPTSAPPGQQSVAGLVALLRKQLGRMPNTQKQLTLQAISALTQLSVRLRQAEQPRPVVIHPAGDAHGA